ncbi:glycosyltransferase family 2 protein [Paenibacillus sp. strain BS8-2]
MATVSVSIVTYNSASDIRTCLEAVYRQSYPIDSVIIVDNASIDHTLDEIRALESGRNNLVIIANEMNNGFAGGQNQAIMSSQSDYVLVLNPDVQLHEDYIKCLVHELENDPNAGSATGMLVSGSDHALIDSTGLVMGLLRQARDRGAGEDRARWGKSDYIFGTSGAASLYARRMVADISIEGEFFDEQFFAYKEDVDVAWRAQILGWKSIYVPRSTAIHARGWKKSGRAGIPLFVRQHSYNNRFFLLIKNESMSPRSFIQIPVILVLEIMKLGYIIFREPDLLSSWHKILRLLPDMLRKRALIQEKQDQR